MHWDDLLAQIIIWYSVEALDYFYFVLESIHKHILLLLDLLNFPVNQPMVVAHGEIPIIYDIVLFLYLNGAIYRQECVLHHVIEREDCLLLLVLFQLEGPGDIP